MTWKNSITLEETITLLNELLKLDEPGMRALIEQRVPCNKALADHPTVQVQAREDAQSMQTVVGVLGILNGLFGTDEEGWGPITANFEDGCTELLSFEQTPAAIDRERADIERKHKAWEAAEERRDTLAQVVAAGFSSHHGAPCAKDADPDLLAEAEKVQREEAAMRKAYEDARAAFEEKWCK
jgi:hypothetical protein